MNVLRASSHQGATTYKGHGKQCITNSLQAISFNYASPPRLWDTKDLDDILVRGDETYLSIATEGQYLTFNDIPRTIAVISESYHGTIRGKTDYPFYSLLEAINTVFSKHIVCGCIFCMGKSTPSYASAILKNDDYFYFFDSHSRNKFGMMCAEGKACVSRHSNIYELCEFIQRLAKSLNIDNAPFELAKVTMSKVPLDTDYISSCESESSFSGFDEVSEGEYSCRCVLNQDHVKQIINKANLSDFSDSDTNAESIDRASIDHQIDECINNLNDSTSMINEINCSLFDNVLAESDNDQHPSKFDVVQTMYNTSDTDYSDSNDENYYPDSSDFSSDDNLPLSTFVKRKVLNPKEANVYHNKSQDSPINAHDNDNTDMFQTSQFNNQSPSFSPEFTSSVVVSEKHVPLKRSRKSKPETWHRNVQKYRKNSGKSYIGKGHKLRSPKKMKLSCGQNCRYKCNSHFSENERDNIFHMFWSMSSIDKQRQFLSNNTVKKNKKSNAKNYSRRSSSIDWFIPKTVDNLLHKVKVCKTFFLNTLAISDKMVSTTHNKQTKIGVCSDDQRGKHANRPNQIHEEALESARLHISSFKVLESHYCRKDSTKLYLPSGLSLLKMYRMYAQKCSVEGKQPVTVSKYRFIFKNEFNLSFYRPKKDQCDLCCKFHNSSPDQKELLKEEFCKHIKNKDLARSQKEKDKSMVKASSDGCTTCVCCFELEQILLTPHAFQSSLYYKRRLNSFNFTVYDMALSTGYCYLWNESVAKRGACEIASCLYKFIELKAKEGVKDFIFYSDNCIAQNKNRFYVSMLWFCLNKFNLNSIVHRYLEKGHTQNEGDSIHSCIENASRHIPIYTTEQWGAVIRGACRKHPYQVNEMTLRDFLDFKSLASQIRNFDLNSENEKVYWNGIKALKLSASFPDHFQYKNDHDGPCFSVNLFHRSRSSNPNPNELILNQLRDDFVPIPKAKYLDLLDLCKNNIIPRAHHAFYYLLPYE